MGCVNQRSDRARGFNEPAIVGEGSVDRFAGAVLRT
jgi:hypothetical protein